MPYDLDHVPEDNANRQEVKDYVDVKKQAAKHVWEDFDQSE